MEPVKYKLWRYVMTLGEYVYKLNEAIQKRPDITDLEVYYEIEEPKHSYKLDTDIFVPIIDAGPTVVALDGDKIVVINS